METLQRAGVAAGVVADAEDLCVRDPQLRARGYWVTRKSPEGEEVRLDGVPYKFSSTPAFVSGPGPLLGEHTDEVLRTVLDFSEAEIARLKAQKIVASWADIAAERSGGR
jgi:crotonobetainyl-CoA:carnitine CoA-transferase CaiB-like acyl-CoA transferase